MSNGADWFRSRDLDDNSHRPFTYSDNLSICEENDEAWGPLTVGGVYVTFNSSENRGPYTKNDTGSTFYMTEGRFKILRRR